MMMVKKKITEVKLKMKKRKEYSLRTKCIPRNHERSIFLLLTPEHNNLGDHAIAEAQKQFFKKYFPEFKLYEINYLHFQNERQQIKKRIQTKDIIVISGGGYLGDVWPHDDEMVRSIVREYKNNQIIIFPQTIYYTGNNSTTFEMARKDYEAHENLLFCVRDTNSYKLLQSLNMKGKSEVMFVPDMVLYWQTKLHDSDRDKVGVCFRNDIEKNIAEADTIKTISYLKGMGADIVKFDTQLGYDVSVVNREYELDKLIRMYSTFKYVVTDRLHAMLFATITGTPCIAFDNVTHKLSGVYPWIEDLGYIWIIESGQDIQEYIKKIGNNVSFSPDIYHQEFNNIYIKMKERIY